jgi:hypothetical protein
MYAPANITGIVIIVRIHKPAPIFENAIEIHIRTPAKNVDIIDANRLLQKSGIYLLAKDVRGANGEIIRIPKPSHKVIF